MLIGIPRETRPGETRVAATPETVKKLAASGAHAIVVEVRRGHGVEHSRRPTTSPPAQRSARPRDALGADLVLKVRVPTPRRAAAAQVRRGARSASSIPFDTAGVAGAARRTGVTGFALESLPRISRAQSMDVLSSQANIAGYKAVMLAANEYAQVHADADDRRGHGEGGARAVMGVGVAGLQAIATAKRLGAVIEATDVRPSVKDQVESLGAKWVDVPYANDEERKIAEGVGGYARPMPPEWMARQAGDHRRAREADGHRDHDRADSRTAGAASSSRRTRSRR